MIEDDFYEVEEFSSLTEEKAKANLSALLQLQEEERMRDRMSPYDILVSENSNIDPGILNLPPLSRRLLEAILRQVYTGGGYLVGNAVNAFLQKT
jgi:hypothetical protein